MASSCGNRVEERAWTPFPLLPLERSRYHLWAFHLHAGTCSRWPGSYIVDAASSWGPDCSRREQLSGDLTPDAVLQLQEWRRE